MDDRGEFGLPTLDGEAQDASPAPSYCTLLQEPRAPKLCAGSIASMPFPLPTSYRSAAVFHFDYDHGLAFS